MGMDLFDHAPILVPADCVLMDYSQPPQSSFLYRTSNGLAAGNSKAEAAVSALLEVIERDCIADFDEFTAQERAAAKLTSQSVLDALDPMIPEGLARGQAHVDVWDIKNDLGIPCFYAIVQSGFSQHTGKFIRGFAGSGAHLNSDVALSRAVTEAVQSPAQHPAQLMTSRIFEGEMARPYRRLSISCPTAGEDLDVILSTLYRNGCSSAALIDLTHTDKDIPRTIVLKTRKLVFVGPSLTPDDKTNFNQAQYAPPCEEGDVIRAMDAGFKAVGIIDGFFGDRRAVSHKEILLALSKGVAVYGAASMGALRAAELDSWGMQGVGSIYEKYRCGKFMDDGDVAVTHGPAELEFPVTSLAVVDVEATLASLVARGAFFMSNAVGLRLQRQGLRTPKPKPR